MKYLINRLSIASMAVFALLLSACSSGPDVLADYDRAADFSGYRTYNFVDGAGPDGQGYQSLFTKYMLAAISREMDSRGYTVSDNPDLLVNFNALIQDKTKITTTPSSMGGYYGYRGGYYGPWGGYGYGTETNVSQYTEGTFNIDLIDARKKQLVWEAVGVGRITEKKLKNLEQSVNEGVPKFFANYPFRAGETLPVPVKQ